MIGFQNGREEGALFACQPFFLLDSQVRLKDCLTILRALRARYVGGCVLELQGTSREIIGWPSSLIQQPARRGYGHAINPGSLCCDRIVHESDFRSWFRFMFV